MYHIFLVTDLMVYNLWLHYPFIGNKGCPDTNIYLFKIKLHYNLTDYRSELTCIFNVKFLFSCIVSYEEYIVVKKFVSNCYDNNSIYLVITAKI